MADLNEEIRKLKGEGKSLRRIGAAFNMSHETVRKRLKRVEDKDQVSTNPEDQLTEPTIEKRIMSIPPKPRRSRASEASGDGVNPLSTQETAFLRSGEGVNPRQRPRRGPQRGKKTASQEVCSGGDDLLSFIRDTLETKGVEMYRMNVEPEAYQVKHNGQIIKLYVQRKIGVGKGQEETE